MLYYDLTRRLEPGMPVYPGDPEVSFAPHAGYAEHGFRVTALRLGTHAGTHLDAPAHFLSAGAAVDELSLSALIGEAQVVDHTAPLPAVEPGDRVLVRSGWAARWGCENYFSNFPALGEALAGRLAAAPAALVGLETPSLDPDEERDARLHRLLLEAGVVIVENLIGLDRLPGRVFLAVLPLPLAGADGSPCRAVAWDAKVGGA